MDSWPLLETLRRSRDLPAFRALLQAALAGRAQLLMSEVNQAEVFYTIARDRGLPASERLMEQLSLMPIRILAPGPGDGVLAGRLKAQWRMSLADCFCIVLAQRFNATVVTADPDFRRPGLEAVIELEWLGA